MPSGQHQTAVVTWRDRNIPVSTRFDDPYFSLAGGLAETRHVFLSGNDLPARFCPGFHIAELGFGTGLNMLASWQLWLESGQRTDLQFTSFEAFPMALQDLQTALTAFPEIAHLSMQFLDLWRDGITELVMPGIHVQIIYGDANHTVPRWNERADAWFLDGFSPAKNPELWRPDLLAAVGARTNSNGTCATYSAAGHVRQALSNAGFAVDRVPGFANKRHMTTGLMKAQP